MDDREKIMGSALGVLLITAVLVVPALAKKPLFGEMDLEFNLLWPGPQDQVPDWAGTIAIDGETYGMLFFAIGSGKPFADDPPGLKVHFFKEIWAIYDMDGEEFPGLPEDDTGAWLPWLPSEHPDELVMWGYDSGITNLANSKYHMTGNIEEAFGDFAEWEGRSVYMSGIIIWDGAAPSEAPGTLRAN